ncbi:efflux RND transporter periplasmic adaptor subunit [Sphaerotilaceae bacterium SBD11-9]
MPQAISLFRHMLVASKPYRWPAAGLVCLLGLAVWLGPRLLLGPRVLVSVVAQRDFVLSVVASGHVETPHRVNIGTQILGSARRVPVAEGQAVSAGQVLVELENSELKAAAAQAEVAVRQAEARVRQLREVQAPMATAALQQAQVTLDSARSQWQRNTDLFKQGFIGQAALDDSRKAVELAEAQLRSARAQFDSAQPHGSDAAIAQAALAQAQANAVLAHARLRYDTITAPAAGTLIARDVEPGDVVQPGKTLMVLSPTGTTQLVIQIDEKNLHLLAPGQAARASADAYPEHRFAARLVYINPGVDVQRGSVEVKLDVPEPPGYLRQDMTVSVDIEVAARARAVLVPLDAVHDANSPSPWVWKVEDGRVRRRALQLGLRSGGMAEVLQGLAAADQVVPVSQPGLREGSRLRAIASAAR